MWMLLVIKYMADISIYYGLKGLSKRGYVSNYYIGTRKSIPVGIICTHIKFISDDCRSLLANSER